MENSSSAKTFVTTKKSHRHRKKTHAHCLLCGNHNPLSLRLHFSEDKDGVYSKFKGRRFLQGYDGILHGGVTAALLDSAMTHCLFHHGIQAVTAEIHIRYLKPIPCEAELELRASLRKVHPPLFTVHAEITLGDDLVAEADAKFMEWLP